MSEVMSEQASQYQSLVEKCWSDEVFKKQLIADPMGTLAQEGWALPEGIRVEVVEETGQVKYLLIPARQEAIDDASLESVSGGKSRSFSHQTVTGPVYSNISITDTSGTSGANAFAFANFPSNWGMPST